MIRAVNPKAYSVRSSHGDGAVRDCSHVYEVCLLGQPSTTKVVHVSRLRTFCARANGTSQKWSAELQATATADYRQYVIEALIGHKVVAGELYIKVQWLGFEIVEASFEPVAEVRSAESMLYTYAHDHQHQHVLLRELYENIRGSKAAKTKARAAKRLAQATTGGQRARPSAKTKRQRAAKRRARARK